MFNSTAYKWANGNIGEQLVYGVVNEIYMAPQAWVTPNITKLNGTITSHPDDRMAGMSIVPGSATAKATTKGATTAIKIAKSQSVHRTALKQAVQKVGCFVGGTKVITVDSSVAIDSIQLGQLVAVSLEHAEDPLF